MRRRAVVRAVQPRGTHIQEQESLQVAEERRRQEEHQPAGRGVARRVQALLLRALRFKARRLWQRERSQSAPKEPPVQELQMVLDERLPRAVRARRIALLRRGQYLQLVHFDIAH